MKPEVLIVEDDRKISNLISIYLANEGYSVKQAYDGEEGKELYLLHRPCLLILDLMLPKWSGEELCRFVKEESKESPGVIMLSAKGTTEDRISGLRLGADDYMTKPFSPEELMAHVEAVLRRTGHLCHKLYHKGLEVKPRKGEVWLEGEQLELTHYEFNLLSFMMNYKDQVFTREQMLEQIHPHGESDIMTRTIDAHIKKLRRKIEVDASDPKRIVTVRGMGYKYASH